MTVLGSPGSGRSHARLGATAQMLCRSLTLNTSPALPYSGEPLETKKAVHTQLNHAIGAEHIAYAILISTALGSLPKMPALMRSPLTILPSYVPLLTPMIYCLLARNLSLPLLYAPLLMKCIWRSCMAGGKENDTLEAIREALSSSQSFQSVSIRPSNRVSQPE
jgi:hypothetical protein